MRRSIKWDKNGLGSTRSTVALVGLFGACGD